MYLSIKITSKSVINHIFTCMFTMGQQIINLADYRARYWAFFWLSESVCFIIQLPIKQIDLELHNFGFDAMLCNLQSNL